DSPSRRASARRESLNDDRDHSTIHSGDTSKKSGSQKDGLTYRHCSALGPLVPLFRSPLKQCLQADGDTSVTEEHWFRRRQPVAHPNRAVFLSKRQSVPSVPATFAFFIVESQPIHRRPKFENTVVGTAFHSVQSFLNILRDFQKTRTETH